VVAGVCCDEVVDQKDSAETQAYLEALAKFEAACQKSCTPDPCPTFNKGYCLGAKCVPFTG
jgi:hypothetical protein